MNHRGGNLLAEIVDELLQGLVGRHIEVRGSEAGRTRPQLVAFEHCYALSRGLEMPRRREPSDSRADDCHIYFQAVIERRIVDVAVAGRFMPIRTVRRGLHSMVLQDGFVLEDELANRVPRKHEPPIRTIRIILV